MQIQNQDGDLNNSKFNKLEEEEDKKDVSISSNKAKLYRGVNSLMTITYSINYIGSVPCLITYLNYGLGTGGAITMIWGFVIGSFFSFLTALSLGEICSAYPQNGSVYIWSRKLTNDKYTKILSFQVGWCYLFGSFTALSTNCIAAAAIFNSILHMYNPTWHLDIEFQVFIAIMINVIYTLINFMRIDDMTWINHITVIQTIGSTLVIMIVLGFFAPIKSDSSFVFGDFFNTTNIQDDFYVISIGLMMSVFCLTGYDSAGQLGEETDDPEINSPNGIIQSVLWSSLMTFSFILVLMYNIGGSSDSYLHGLVQDNNMIIGIFRQQFTNQNLILFLSYNVMFMLILNGVSSVTGLSRVMLSMCENRCLPFSDYFAVTSENNQSPVRILLFTFATQIYFCTMIIYSPTAYNAFGDVNTACWQFCYLVVVAQRLYNADNLDFEKNKFTLGKYSKALNWVCLIWLIFSGLVMQFPNQLNSLRRETFADFNYSPVMMIFSFVCSFAYYELKAKHRIVYKD